MARLDLVAPDGSLRNAAVELLCEGSDTYPKMKLGLLGGNTKDKILDLRRECGTMLKLLDFAKYFVASNIRWRSAHTLRTPRTRRPRESPQSCRN